jgi:sialic acid synthase SpsE
MRAVKFANGRSVGDDWNPYFIAELNTSHFGDLSLAKDMILQAKECGCDCVKFQSWSASSLYSKSYYGSNAIAKRIINKFSLSESDMLALAEYSRGISIDFASTPYSLEEAMFLRDSCNVPFIKIASMELDNLRYLSQLAELHVPLVLSTGMGSFDEIDRAVDVILSTGNESLVILHCISIYPCDEQHVQLLNITGLRDRFPGIPIGFSDHTLGCEIPIASISLNACVIEKHFTLDSGRIGMDNQMATEPDDMRRMVMACRKVFRSLGTSQRIVAEEEVLQLKKMRRSAVATRRLLKGDHLTESDFSFKRPATGIPPNKIDAYLGRRLMRDVEEGEHIGELDFD